MKFQLIKTLKTYVLTDITEVNIKIDVATNVELGGYCTATIKHNNGTQSYDHFDNTLDGWTEFNTKLDSLFANKQIDLDKKAKNLIEFETFAKMSGFEQI